MTRRSLWTAAAIARATGGRVSRAFQVRGISIDTRTLEPGDLFVALGGARDGHDFVDQAMAAGAAGVLASRPVDAPHVQVDDTFLALQALALAARERAVDARRGAVTGSVGKTSVTQAVAAGLALAGRAHASIKSYNNHIGVLRDGPAPRHGHHHGRACACGELPRRGDWRRAGQGRDL